MVVATADCFAQPPQGVSNFAKLKEHFLAGLQQQVAALQAYVDAAESAVPAPVVESTSNKETVASKLATCQTLAEEAMCGKVQAAVSVAAMLTDASPEARGAAATALSCIAEFGPRPAADAAAATLALSDMGLRWRSHEHSAVAAALAARVGM